MSLFNLSRPLRASWMAVVFTGFSFSTTADTVRLQWDPSSDGSVTRYRVYSSASSADTFSPVLETSALEANISLPGSLVGYRFYVTALDAQDAESDPSNAVTFGPRLNYLRYADSLSISWNPAGFTLQSAPTLQGPWTTRSATSPVLIEPTGASQFFRLLKN